MFLLEVKRDTYGGYPTVDANWLPYRIVGAPTIHSALSLPYRIPNGHIGRFKRIDPVTANQTAATIRSIWGENSWPDSDS